ncbi:MAG: T9SS type A sorting domain-containing protein [Flavobacteriales bacterium]|nr:T9SS type A sorting domain-containing protein [Flavobacteriales bacterium]
MNAAADSMLQAMPQERTLKPGEETERTRMISYIGILAAAGSAGRTSWQLDSAEVAQLSTLVGIHYDRPAIWAGNLLCAAYGKCRAPYTGGDATPKNAKPGRTRKPITGKHSFTAHPNPANSYVVLSHQVPSNTGTLHLVVRDLSGRGLKHFTATGEIGQTVWDTRGITPGVYTVELQHEGRSLETLRVVVQP